MFIRPHTKVSLAAGCVMALTASAFVFCVTLALPPQLHDFLYDDAYFDADIPRAWLSLTDRWGDDYRANIHPLFLLLVGLPTIIAGKIVGSPHLAVAAALALNAAVLVALLFHVLLGVTGRVLDATLISALFLATGSFLFWSPIPETFPFGATSILLPIALLTVTDERLKRRGFLLAAILSIGITPTNVMATMVCALLVFGSRQTIKMVLMAAIAVLVLWGIQKILFRSAELLPDLARESRYIGWSDVGHAVRQFFLDSAYPMGVVERSGPTSVPMLTLEKNPASATSLHALAIWSLWVGVLLLGLSHILRSTVANALPGFAAAATLSGQLLLHSIYGASINFLYSLHWMPMLILVVAYATRSRLRPLLLGACVLLALVMAPRNYLLQQDSISKIVTTGAAGPM